MSTRWLIDANDRFGSWGGSIHLSELLGSSFRTATLSSIPAILLESNVAQSKFHPSPSARLVLPKFIPESTSPTVKSPAFRPPVANVLGRGADYAEGEEHKKMRRVLTTAFSPEVNKGIAEDIFECSEKLESRLTNRILSHGGGATVNINEHKFSCTLDIIDHRACRVGTTSNPTSPRKRRRFAHPGENHVNSGITFGAFIVMLIIRAFPDVFVLPLPAIKAGGRIRGITAFTPSSRPVECGAFNDCGRDILSILMTAKKEGESKDSYAYGGRLRDNGGSLSFMLLEIVGHPEG
ncbi:uncharacterized protein LAESUDRAFT_761627 [Laetiporus sulphureus 93-53]|uniref:Cytochrome P450 n=1 Tax=Laetiporus sulphureus 93-53 TaxID=1314785 RepID=A0A165CYY8_9APHY|nr:uncharacterized protein LAESUDRAFT_761627 [Laetiporus sulphureus 93-53]KZT03778.1 hypothetical protein LAESUDRAFT_761627 [Laetiporus sulphureus 93-53]